MKKYNSTKGTTLTFSILLVLFLIVDGFLLKHLQDAPQVLAILVIRCIFTIYWGYGIISNIQKNSKHKKARNLKERGITNQITTKVIRFDFEHSVGSPNIGKSYFYIVASDGQNQYKSEPFRGKVIGYDPLKLGILGTVGIDYNIMNIEPAIEELSKITTKDDLENRVNNTGWFAGRTFNVFQTIMGGFYETLLLQVDECKKYLKEISKAPEFKRSYLEYKHHQIHIGDSITVYVDPNHPTVYQLDTDFFYND